MDKSDWPEYKKKLFTAKLALYKALLDIPINKLKDGSTELKLMEVLLHDIDIRSVFRDRFNKLED